MIKSHQRFLNLLIFFLDIVVILTAFISAWFIRFRAGLFYHEVGHIDFWGFLIPSIIIVPVFLVVNHFLGLYRAERNTTLGKEIEGIAKSNAFVFLVFLGLLFALKQTEYSRLALGIFSLLNFSYSVIERIFVRFVLRHSVQRGMNLNRVLVIGAGEPAQNFVTKIGFHKYLGYNIIGHLDDDIEVGDAVQNSKVLGKIDDLEQIVSGEILDEIIIAIELKQYEKLGSIIGVCEKYGIKAQIIPDYYRYIPAKPYIDQIDDLQLINIRYVPLDDSLNKFVKRVSDIFLSAIGILITAPVLFVTAILVKTTSRGPIIFSQVRVGLHRREFKMYKFRSMRVQKDEEECKQWTTKQDPRKTKFGEFLRKTSIDELPQLFNVLKGDMSLIGPRPERPFFVEKFRDEIPKYMVKHHVRPGITGWAQVNGFRGDTSIKSRIEHDLYYIENWSIWLDIRIICLTVLRGFINKNAY